MGDNATAVWAEFLTLSGVVSLIKMANLEVKIIKILVTITTVITVIINTIIIIIIWM